MRYLMVSILVLVICLGVGVGIAGEKKFGKDLTVEETTAISMINEKPATFADKELLVTGKVVDMCRHRGCWVTIEAEDKTQVLCRSLDESIQFPVSVLERKISLQGKLLYDKDAPGTVMKTHEEGEKPHACPNPQVMVSITGALVEMADVDAEVKEAEPKAE